MENHKESVKNSLLQNLFSHNARCGRHFESSRSLVFEEIRDRLLVLAGIATLIGKNFLILKDHNEIRLISDL